MKKDKEKWVLFGLGNFFSDILECIELNNGEIVEVVLNIPLNKRLLESLPKNIQITKSEEFKPQKKTNYFIGFLDPNKEGLLKSIEKHNLAFSNLIHPFSFVSLKAEMGRGNYVGPGVVIAPNVKMGDFNILNRNTSIGHDTALGDMNHIAPGATVLGRGEIGNKVLIGAGATLLDGIKVADQVVIGAGSVVLKSIEFAGTYVGSPARKIK